MLKGIRLLTVVLLALAISGYAAAQDASGGVIRMDFLLNWTITGDHAPYYVALQKGWYDEVGLDVNITLGQGSGFSVQSVDAGRAHMGIADAPVAVAGRAEGAGVTIVGIIFDKHPNSMFFWSDTEITEPQDLVGKTVAVPASDGHRVMWPAFAQLIGVDPNSVSFVNIAPAAKVTALSARRADVVFELFTGKPFMEKAIPPEQLGNLLWADYGFDLYAHSYIASDEVIANNPEMIRRFLDASYRAWEYTLQNPEEAIAILAEYHPINREDYLANLMLVREFFMTDRYKNDGIGFIDLERAQVTVDMVEDYQGIDVDFTASEMFDGSFLPVPMYRFDF